MTKEQKEKAIAQLERISKKLASIDDDDDYTAFAIEALERDHCEDCISREEFIERYIEWHYSEYGLRPRYDTLAIRVANSLPSVRPQEPKAGHWTKETDDSRTWDRIRFYCSECKSWQTYGKSPFCPNCGAKMEESEGR